MADLHRRTPLRASALWIAGLAGLASLADVVAGRAAIAAAEAAATAHPHHDAVAEARVSADGTRIEVVMQVDAGHLEAAVSHRFGARLDLRRASGGSPDERRLAAYVRERMQARFVPQAGVDAIVTPAADWFDLHWIGRELVGPDCRLIFEWIPPPARLPADRDRLDATADDPGADATAEATGPRRVQVRAMVLVEPRLQQVNTVRVAGHGTATFDSDQAAWAEVGLRMSPRRPAPVRVARAGEAGPRVLVVPGPNGPGRWERAVAAGLRDAARVELVSWPGRDGGPPPPEGSEAGGWLAWAAESLAARTRRGVPPAAIVATDPGALVLLAAAGRIDGAPVPSATILAAPRPAPAPAPSSTCGFARAVAERYVRELSAVRTRPVPEDALLLEAEDAADVAARTLELAAASGAPSTATGGRR